MELPLKFGRIISEDSCFCGVVGGLSVVDSTVNSLLFTGVELEKFFRESNLVALALRWSSFDWNFLIGLIVGVYRTLLGLE